MSKSLDGLKKRGADILGVTSTSVGKTQARQNLLPLVDNLNKTHTILEITDHEQPVAVLLSYNNWLTLISKLVFLTENKPDIPVDLMGSVTIVGNLEEGSRRAAAEFSLTPKEL